MRITIEIDDKSLVDIQKLTGIKKKSTAISLALKNYLRDVRKQKLLKKVLNGDTDYPVSNTELEAMSIYDHD